MIPLSDLSTYLDSALRLADFEDYPNALNGLQVENGGEINKVVSAVDACEATIAAAVEAGADLLLVHHGLFWGGLGPVTGASYRKMRLAIENGLAIYSAHLPLDAHPEVGNNVLLCEALKLKHHREPFFPVKGRPIGIRVEEQINREVLLNRIEVEVGGRVILAPGGPVSTSHIGIVTGGAGADLAKAAAEGVDTFITGEAPHWCYSAAEELGINLFLAGHYATEVYGVKALGQHIGERFHIDYEFIDHPSGL
ncbi:MAG: Nif3-like dinuclear metal center hexameric protein [Terrimicrobiaceae bacterium]